MMKGLSTITLIFLLASILNLSIVLAEPDTITIYQTQKKLKELGYDTGVVDGVWGKKTENAVIQFQCDNKLSATGQLDEETKTKLGLKEPAQKISNDITSNTQNEIEILYSPDSKEQKTVEINSMEMGGTRCDWEAVEKRCHVEKRVFRLV